MERSFSWGIDQNALSHSDCRIFKSTISPEKINETALFFAWWSKFTKIKSWSKIFWFDMVKNGCGQSRLWTPRLIVSQERTEGTNYFFFLLCMLVQFHTNFSGDRTLKSTTSEELNDGINWFFACWYRITKIKSWSKIFWVGICQKWVWTIWSWNSKIDCISKVNRWNKVIFFMMVRIQES